MTVEHRNEQASIPRVPWRIVLVEDNPEDIVLLREVIHDENLPVELQIFPDGESALSLINALEEDPRTPRPHLFLIDLNLPKADGFMLLRQIRNSERYQSLPVIIISSSDSPYHSSQAVQLGGSFFRKPTSLDEYMALAYVLRTALERIQNG